MRSTGEIGNRAFGGVCIRSGIRGRFGVLRCPMRVCLCRGACQGRAQIVSRRFPYGGRRRRRANRERACEITFAFDGVQIAFGSELGVGAFDGDEADAEMLCQRSFRRQLFVCGDCARFDIGADARVEVFVLAGRSPPVELVGKHERPLRMSEPKASSEAPLVLFWSYSKLVF